MMRELGQMISPLTVVDHFDGLLDGFVLDQQDAVLRRAVVLPTLVTDTMMTDMASKSRLARELLDFAGELMGATVPVVPPTPSGSDSAHS